MNSHRGFTLIELLVVIAIISLLSAVVLSALKSARDRGANATVRSSLKNLQSQAAIYFDTNGNYTTLCSDPQFVKGRDAASMAAAGNTTSYTCNAATVSGEPRFALSVPLKVADGMNNYWCIDYSGISRGHASALGGATTCP